MMVVWGIVVLVETHKKKKKTVLQICFRGKSMGTDVKSEGRK